MNNIQKYNVFIKFLWILVYMVALKHKSFTIAQIYQDFCGVGEISVILWLTLWNATQ